MTRLSAGTFVAVALLACTACATPLAARQPAPGNDEVQRQLFKLQKDSQRILALLEEQSADQGAGANAACAETATRVEELGRGMRILEEQLLETQAKLDMAIAELRALRRASAPTYSNVEGLPPAGSDGGSPATATGGQASTPATSAPGSGPQTTAPAEGTGGSPEELFNAAYADFSRGKYQLALMGFESSLAMDPEGPMAETARYYVGETLLAMGRFSDAVEVFDMLLAGSPSGSRALTIQYKRGVALFEARRVVEGVQALQGLIDEAPDSDEARLARDYLRTRGIVEE
jgi:TolA-binding protein